MSDMQVEGRPLPETTTTAAAGQTTKSVQTSSPSATIHASKVLPAKAGQITEIATKSMPQESGALATIKRAATAFEKSAVGKFFGAIALKIASVFERHLLGVSSEAKQPSTTVPGEKPKVDLQKLFGENNNTQAVKDAICKADPFTVVTDFMDQLTAMYDHTANPTRAAQKFVKEALRELPPQAAKDWNAKLAAQQHDDLQGVFENAASDEELIANIQAVKAADPKVQFLCELRGVVAERLSPDKTVAGIQVEQEFLKPETDLVKQEIENLEREIEALGDEDPDKQVEKRKHFAEALLQAGSHEELETFSTFTDEQLDAYVQKLREQRDELEKDLSAVQRHQPNPALQKALTS